LGHAPFLAKDKNGCQTKIERNQPDNTTDLLESPQPGELKDEKSQNVLRHDQHTGNQDKPKGVRSFQKD
jgi:hypothetical protein